MGLHVVIYNVVKWGRMEEPVTRGGKLLCTAVYTTECVKTVGGGAMGRVVSCPMMSKKLPTEQAISLRFLRCPYKTSLHKTSTATKRRHYKTSPHKTSPVTKRHPTKRHQPQNVTSHKTSPATKHHQSHKTSPELTKTWVIFIFYNLYL